MLSTWNLRKTLLLALTSATHQSVRLLPLKIPFLLRSYTAETQISASLNELSSQRAFSSANFTLEKGPKENQT